VSDDPTFPPTTGHLDEASGRMLVETWRSSGLSGAAFCRQHSIRAQRLHYWRERLGYPMRVVGSPRPSVAGPSVPPTEGFVQVVVAPPSAPPPAYVEVVVGEAVVRVRSGFDACLLRDVLRAMTAG
jgi:hypothetical protein